MKKIYFKSLRPVAVAAVVAMLGTAAPAAMAQDDSTVETLDTETQEAIQAEYEEMIALWQELQLAYAELQERLDAEADLYSEEKLAYFTEQSGLIATTLQQFYNLIQASYEEAMQTGEFEVEYFRLTYQSLAGMISELQFNMDCAKAYAEYEEMTEQVQELFMAYIELQSLLDEEYAGYYDEAESAAIAQALAALQAEIQEAMELSQQTGEFYVENFRQTYQEIYNAILALQQSAENAKAYAEYEEMIELWNELTVAYAELQETLEADYAGLYDEAESAAIAQAIYALYNDIQAALEISQQTGVFEVEGFHQQYNDIVAAMQALLQSAENAAAYAEYEEMIELWNELTVAYAELQDLLETEYAGLYDEAESAAIAQAIYALYNDIQAALEISQQTGVFEVEGFHQQYNDIVAAMQALLQSAENAAAYAEYEEMIELWNELTVAYAELQDLLETEYAGLYDEAESAAIAQAIYALYNDIQAALEISQQTGVFEVEGFHQQYNDIVAAMQALLQSAEEEKTLGIAGIGTDAKGAIYFDLNGNSIAKPASGRICIRVIDGKAQKVVID